ncbi:NifU-like protein [Escherichia coli]|nr:NifU-like protein [Escherichia coli]
MAYSEKVIDHYENPRNVGSFDNNDENVGSGMVGAPACGDVMKLQIKVNDEGIIEDARFKNLRLRFRYRFQLPGHRMGEREVSRRSAGDQKHRYC